jgi:hypothetical protein
MRNWNIYLNSDEDNEDVLTEWEEVLIKDFLQHSKEWLAENRDDIFWRLGLE